MTILLLPRSWKNFVFWGGAFFAALPWHYNKGGTQPAESSDISVAVVYILYIRRTELSDKSIKIILSVFNPLATHD